MKIVMCMDKYVAKKSDSVGKDMCESKEYDDYLTNEIKYDLSKNKY